MRRTEATSPQTVPPQAAASDTPADGASDFSLGHHVRTVSLLTLGSRVLGLVRDLILVRVFGDTAVGSAFAAAWAIPNLFRRLLGEGALSAAFLPEYARTHQADAQRAHEFASLTLAMLALLSTAIVVAGEGILLALLLLAGDDPERALSLRLIMVLLPLMPMVCVVAMLGAMLQVHGRFGPFAAAPAILNVCMIGASLLHFAGPRLDPVASAYAIGGAALLAGVAQMAWCAAALRGRVRWTRLWSGATEPARRMVRTFLPVALGLGTIQLNALLDTIIAMWPNWFGPSFLGLSYPLDEASNAVLSFTQRLYQFPLGVFGIAVATVAFPALSRHATDGDRFGRALGHAVRMSLAIGLPAGIGLALVREDLVAVMFGWGGGFSAEGLDRAAAVLLGYAVAVWAYSLNHVLVRGFYARGDTSTPVRIAVWAVVLNLALNLALIWPLREAGLAWSTAASAMFQSALLWRLSGGRLLGAAGAWRLATACAGMAGVVVAIGVVLEAPSDAARLLRLAVGVAAGAATYGVLAMALGVREVAELLTWPARNRR